MITYTYKQNHICVRCYEVQVKPVKPVPSRRLRKASLRKWCWSWSLKGEELARLRRGIAPQESERCLARKEVHRVNKAEEQERRLERRRDQA